MCWFCGFLERDQAFQISLTYMTRQLLHLVKSRKKACKTGFQIKLPTWIERIHSTDLLWLFYKLPLQQCTMGLGSSALAKETLIIRRLLKPVWGTIHWLCINHVWESMLTFWGAHCSKQIALWWSEHKNTRVNGQNIAGRNEP